MKFPRFFAPQVENRQKVTGRKRVSITHKLSMLLALPLFVAMVSANASPITFTDFYDPVPGAGDLRFATTANDAKTFTFTHDINDGPIGFNALTDTITNVMIALRFVDDDDTVAESVAFSFDSASYGTTTLLSGTTIDSRSFTLPNSFLQDGLLTVKLDLAGLLLGDSKDRSDFNFIDSTLTVSAERKENVNALGTPLNNVPEPATGLLTGLGFLGLGWVLRKKS